MTPSVVVLGVGNLIMGDEGVGVRAVEALQASSRLPAHVRTIDGGTSTHELLEPLEHLDLLVILDAVVSDAPPGTIVRLDGDRITVAFSNRLSPHQHGINDVLAQLALLGRSPKRVLVFGVVPERIELDLALSEAVSAAIPRLCDQVVAAVETASGDAVA